MAQCHVLLVITPLRPPNQAYECMGYAKVECNVIIGVRNVDAGEILTPLTPLEQVMNVDGVTGGYNFQVSHFADPLVKMVCR